MGESQDSKPKDCGLDFRIFRDDSEPVSQSNALIMFLAFLSDRTVAFMVFFYVFVILMLPFGSPLLSTKLRAYLGLRKVMAILVLLFVIVPTVLAVLAPEILESPNERFAQKGQRYYSKLANACDTVLAEHPLGTNQVIRISATDPTLPKIITDLHPVRIEVQPSGLWMMLISDSRAGFAVEWGQQKSDTNVWELSSGGENMFTTDYTAKRNPFPSTPSHQ